MEPKGNAVLIYGNQDSTMDFCQVEFATVKAAQEFGCSLRRNTQGGHIVHPETFEIQQLTYEEVKVIGTWAWHPDHMCFVQI